MGRTTDAEGPLIHDANISPVEEMFHCSGA
jgi:hypothetical protein